MYQRVLWYVIYFENSHVYVKFCKTFLAAFLDTFATKHILNFCMILVMSLGFGDVGGKCIYFVLFSDM